MFNHEYYYRPTNWTTDRRIRQHEVLLPINHSYNKICDILGFLLIAHFTATGGNEAGVDLVLIQPFLLYYVNHVVLMLSSIFKS